MPKYGRLLPLALLSLAGAAQAAPPDTNWTRSPLSAMELAKRVDQRLQTLKNTSMDYFYRFNTDVGKGIFVGMGAAKDSKTYRIEYPILGKSEADAIRRQSIIQVGNKIKIATQDADGKDFKVTSAQPPRTQTLPSNMVDGWYTGNVRYMMSAIGSTASPLEALVKSAAARPDLKVASETRVIPFKGTNLRSYRITISRTPTAAKKKGLLFYEIVVGDVYYFPLTMTNRKGVDKHKYGTQMFGTRWKQTVDPKDFNPKIYHVATRAFK